MQKREPNPKTIFAYRYFFVKIIAEEYFSTIIITKKYCFPTKIIQTNRLKSV